MSNPNQPVGEVDPSEGSVQDPAEQQSTQAADADARDAAQGAVDPSEEPSNQ